MALTWFELYNDSTWLNIHVVDLGFCKTFLILKFSSLQYSITVIFSGMFNGIPTTQKSNWINTSVDCRTQKYSIHSNAVFPWKFSANWATVSCGDRPGISWLPHNPEYSKSKGSKQKRRLQAWSDSEFTFSGNLSHFKGFINVQIGQELEQVFVSPSFIHWRWHGFFIQWLTSHKADVDCKPSSEDAPDLLLQGCFFLLFFYLSQLCAVRLWFQGYLIKERVTPKILILLSYPLYVFTYDLVPPTDRGGHNWSTLNRGHSL